MSNTFVSCRNANCTAYSSSASSFCSRKCIHQHRGAIRTAAKNERIAIEYAKGAPKCQAEGCTNLTAWREKGVWASYCSAACRGKHNSLKSRDKAKQTSSDRYGVDNPSKSQKVKEILRTKSIESTSERMSKFKSTLIDRYGVDNPSHIPGVSSKKKDTNLIRYGSTSPSGNLEIKEKSKNTSRERYGVDNPMQSPIVQNKLKNTLIEKYGVDNAAKADAVKSKISNALQNMSEKNKIARKERTVKTNLARRGVEHPAQCKEVQKKAKATIEQKYGKIHYNFKELSAEAELLVTEFERLVELNQKMSLADISATYGISHNTLTNRFRENNVEFKRFSYSVFQKEVTGYLESIGVQNILVNDRKIIAPRELDIVLPEYNIAIECNGSYHHSELNGADRNYHLSKTLQAKDAGLHVVHLWEHDWIQKKDICKSILSAAVQSSQVRLFARKCSVREIEAPLEREFLSKNHIQGYAASKFAYGLFCGNELVAVMSFGKSRFDKSAEWELVRFANTINTNVVGGASKLFSTFVKEHKPSSIVSYCHRHLFSGGLYHALGFSEVRTTEPSYQYTRNHKEFFSRFQFQKKKLKEKLENFHENLSEWENMKLNKWDRIWDCGNKVFMWTQHRCQCSNLPRS